MTKEAKPHDDASNICRGIRHSAFVIRDSSFLFCRDLARAIDLSTLIGTETIQIAMKLLDRYVIRNFLQVYLYCIAGFISIWLIFDVSDNISTFIDEHVSLLLVARYYATQIPQVLIILLPVSLLLSLLFALGRMSRANEIVSMLTAGISLPRVLMPLIGMGLLTVAASMALNYSLAPHAELARKNFLSEAQARPSRYIQGQIFRNRTDLRTWFIQNFLPRGNTFNNVQVLQQDANDNIVTNYVASRASYRPETKTWDLENVKVVHYDHAGNIVDEQIYPSLKIEHWSETPFRLGSANERAEFLSLPELTRVFAFQCGFPRYVARAVSNTSAVPVCSAVDLFGCCLHRCAARNRLFAPRCVVECCRCGFSRLFNELPGAPVSRARRR